MPIIVNSPYSGRPVKVRDQDVGRAIRDESGRVFYALPRSSGDGFYGSPTRTGSPKDEQHADELAAKPIETAAETPTAPPQPAPVHDATGRRRGRMRRVAVLLIVLAAIAAGVWYFLFHTPQGASMREQMFDTPASPSPDAPIGDPPPTVPEPQAQAPDPLPWVATASGLRYRIEEQGHGPIATAGKFVRIGYRASLAGGRSLGSSDDGPTAGFVLWSGQAIRGWDEGIAGMREGEVRTLIVPPQLAADGWGALSDDELPAGPIQFEIALLEVRPGVTRYVLQPGDGAIAQPGDLVEVHYVASVAGSDEPYDDSYRRHAPLRFRIGRGQIIAGWELGMAGMAEGEKRRITIPSYLAYGMRGAGSVIPPDATLRVEVELLRIIRNSDVALTRAPLPRAGG